MGFKEQLEKNEIPAVKVIAEYLMTRPDLKEKLENPKKSLEEMFNYIMSQAKQQASGSCVCLADDIVFGMAVHYYDEDDIKFDKVSGMASTTVSSSSSNNEDKDKEIKKLQEKIKKFEKTRENSRKLEKTQEAKSKKKEKVSDKEMEQISLF